ncbi:MAG: hypothetical protein GX297_07765 [Treponema sp.]|jgi:hypothetical protein|nr:hypothetical protein [Treponema sp.]
MTNENIENNINKKKSKKRKPLEEEEDFVYFEFQLSPCSDTLETEPCDTGIFIDYSVWADTLYGKIIDFYLERGIYPNILLTSDATYDKITEYEMDKPENRRWEGEGEPEEFTGFSSFFTDDFEVLFCIDNEMETNHFKLIYDEDPIFDGEEKPEEQVKRIYKKKAA